MAKYEREAEHLDFLECVTKQGFAIIPGVLALQDIERLLAELSQTNLVRSRAGVRHAMSLGSVSGIAKGSPLLGGVIYAHAPASALSQILALRLHLDDSMADNGPLRVLPETHTLGVLTDDAIHELSTRMTTIDCLVPRGGVLAMRPLIVHGSSKSQGQNPRRVLHIEYAASEITEDGLRLAIA